MARCERTIIAESCDNSAAALKRRDRSKFGPAMLGMRHGAATMTIAGRIVLISVNSAPGQADQGRSDQGYDQQGSKRDASQTDIAEKPDKGRPRRRRDWLIAAEDHAAGPGPGPSGSRHVSGRHEWQQHLHRWRVSADRSLFGLSQGRA